MIRPRYLVGITGRRHLSNPTAVSEALSLVLAELKSHVAERGGSLELYGSIAYGADTLAAQEARKQNIPVHLILPKPVVRDEETGMVDRQKGFASDFWKGDPRRAGVFLDAEWKASLAEIELATSGHNGGTIRITTGSQNEPECYYDAGLQVLEAADVMVAVLDDQADKGLAGSKGLADLAEKKHLPLIIIPAAGGAPERRRISALAIQDAERELIDKVDQFSHQTGQANPRKEESGDELFTRLESSSASESQQFRNSIVRIILAHGAATLVAAAAALLPHSSLQSRIVLVTLACMELSLVLWALMRNHDLSKHDGVHDRWLQTRFAAELMRALRDSVGLLDPLHPLIDRHQPKWWRFAVTAGLLIRKSRPPQAWQTARDAYVQDRLRHPDIHKGQITYFKQKRADAEPIFRRTMWWGTKLGWAALVFVCGAVLFKASDIFRDEEHHWGFAVAFKFLPIALPLLSGIFISLRTALDCGRRTYRFQEVAERLTAFAQILENLETEAAVRRTVATTEEILLDELVEWHLAEQQNGGH